MRPLPARRRALASLAPLAALALAGRARAEPVPFDLAKPGTFKVDGVLKEWGPMVALGKRVSGSSKGPADLAARGAIAYDDGFVYVAMDVTDDKLVRTAGFGANEDRAGLVVAFPEPNGSYTTVEVALFVGDPGNVAGVVKGPNGAPVAGADLVEAPRKGGYTFEAKIPWRGFGPQTDRVRCGLRAALRYYDSDGHGVESVIATAEGTGAQLPHAPTQPEQAVDDALVKDKHLTDPPRVDLVVDVAGDAMRERVMLWGQYLVVAGPHFRDGEQFFFNDFGVDKSQITQFDVRDVTGDGKAEFLVRRREPNSPREVFQVLAMAGETLSTLFQHEVGVVTPQGSIADKVSVSGEGAGAHIEVTVGAAQGGLSAATLKEQPDGDNGFLTPWGTVQSRTFGWDGTHFVKQREQTAPAGKARPAVADAGPARAPQPPPPRPPTADEKLDQVLALYKRDHKVPGSLRPRFDLATDVAEDAQVERILAFGRDLVVLGKGFLGGTGYVSVSLGFADPNDVVDVTTFDLTNDGKAEVIVRGVQRVQAPKELGQGKLEREVVLVYTLQGGRLARVFAAETALALGDKRVGGEVAFVPDAAGGFAITLRPGHAVGWSRASWPYKQDAAPVSGIEPLVLPWTDAESRYAWRDGGFRR